MDDSDLAGPVLFFLIFGTSLLVCSKYALIWMMLSTLAFRQASLWLYIWYGAFDLEQLEPVLTPSLGLALLGSISLHTVLSLMSPPLTPAEAAASSQDHSRSSHFSSSLTFTRSASVLGYCLLPLVLTSLVGILVPMDGLFGYLLTSLAIIWCAYSSSSMFTIVGEFL